MLAIHHSTINLRQVQSVRKAVLLAIVLAGIALMILAASKWPSGTILHEAIEWAGILLIVICIVGRTWCAIYIGGRKVRDLVTLGPYSISRNPLYVFSILGAAGAGAQLGSLGIAAAAGITAATVFYLVITREERVLVLHFGNDYRHYLAAVPRFLPNLSLWRDVERLEVHPAVVRRTFVDACLFLLSIPIAEGFEYLHEIGVVPIWIYLP